MNLKVGQKYRRRSDGRRYLLTDIFWNGTVELSPLDAGRRTWLSPEGFAAKFELVPS